MGFVVSKIISALFTPVAVLGALFVLAELMARSRRFTHKGRILRKILIVLVVFITIFPVGEWALAPLENRFPISLPDHVDGIILLGGDEDPHISAVRGQPSILFSAQRYLQFVALARAYPDARLVFSGGSGFIFKQIEGNEADVARAALGKLGVPVDKMVFENRSRTTFENAQFSAEIIHPTPQQNWLLVTNARHMPRSMATFRKAGWHVYAAPGGYETDGRFHLIGQINLPKHLLELNDALHEYYGLVVYFLTGRSDSLWPA